MKFNLFIVLVITFIINVKAQENNYIIKKIKASALLVDNGKVIDSISTDGIENKNTYLEIRRQIIYMFEFKLPGPGSIGNSYIRITKWKIINDKLDFEKEKYKFIVGYCNVNKLKFKIKEDGIHWCYRKSIFKRLRGVITDEEIEQEKTFRLECE